MKNANAIAAAFVLAALTTTLAGCDIGAAQNPSAVAADASLLPKARHRLDATRNRIWLLDRDGAALIDLARPARETLALADWLRVSEEHGCLPDLALGPKGEAVITSNVVPALWRVD